MDNTKFFLRFLILGLLLITIASSCAATTQSEVKTPPTHTPNPTHTLTPIPSKTSGPTPTNTLSYIDIMPRSWNNYANFDWEHDGDPFESENLTVYSDHADSATKARFAEEAEIALERILTELEIDSFGFHVPINNPEIEVYITSSHQDDVDWECYAHFGGFLLIYDKQFYSRRMLQYPYEFPYTYLITHEMTHTITARILGNRQNPRQDSIRPIPQWLDEGLATYIGTPPFAIRSELYYDIALTNMKTTYDIYFYSLCELKVYYLIETFGMKNSIGILFDMRMLNLTFEEAFENRTGMPIDYFEENYDAIIREFLPED